MRKIAEKSPNQTSALLILPCCYVNHFPVRACEEIPSAGHTLLITVPINLCRICTGDRPLRNQHQTPGSLTAHTSLGITGVRVRCPLVPGARLRRGSSAFILTDAAPLGFPPSTETWSLILKIDPLESHPKNRSTDNELIPWGAEVSFCTYHLKTKELLTLTQPLAFPFLKFLFLK